MAVLLENYNIIAGAFIQLFVSLRQSLMSTNILVLLMVAQYLWSFYKCHCKYLLNQNDKLSPLLMGWSGKLLSVSSSYFPVFKNKYSVNCAYCSYRWSQLVSQLSVYKYLSVQKPTKLCIQCAKLWIIGASLSEPHHMRSTVKSGLLACFIHHPLYG